MIFLLIFSFALLLGVWSIGCGNGPTESASRSNQAPPDSTIILYNFEEPDAAFALPGELLEISGLTAISPSQLAAVQDEKGIIFILDVETAHIVDQARFRGDGDFEGVAFAHDQFWVLRSDGALYSIGPLDEDEVESTRHDTGLHGSCDAEGLAFDERESRLLIACKEDPGRQLGRTRAIYAFDLAGLRRIEAPVYLIDRQQLDQSGDLFKPSALAVHPHSGYLYVLSSVRKLLIVIDPARPLQIQEARELPVSLFGQPEGLAFLPDGTLFISNEGGDGPATLLRFDEHATSH